MLGFGTQNFARRLIGK